MRLRFGCGPEVSWQLDRGTLALDGERFAEGRGTAGGARIEITRPVPEPVVMAVLLVGVPDPPVRVDGMERRLFQLGLILVGIHWLLEAGSLMTLDIGGMDGVANVLIGVIAVGLSLPLGRILYGTGGSRIDDRLMATGIGAYGAFSLAVGVFWLPEWGAAVWLGFGTTTVGATAVRVRVLGRAPLALSAPMLVDAGLAVWGISWIVELCVLDRGLFVGRLAKRRVVARPRVVPDAGSRRLQASVLGDAARGQARWSSRHRSDSVR